MNSNVDIDEIDDKILHILIEDARASLKDIGQKCRISSVSVLNRIKRLRRLGVITGATLYATLDTLGFQIVASIGMETESGANVDEILKFFKEHTYLIEPAVSIGKYDLMALVFAENITALNERVETVRRFNGIRKVVVMVWSGLPNLNFENVKLMTEKC
jgi:Lrp/AsnC family transcriptional regulator for asnA, asnC and gidA